MPTREQINALSEQLDRLVNTFAGESLTDLSATLEAEIDWAGFTAAERSDIERRIFEGEDPEFWMDGIEGGRRSDRDATDQAERDEEDRFDGLRGFIEDAYPNLDEHDFERHGIDHYLTALVAEMREEEHAARIINYGEADAAVFEQRVKDAADTVQHLEPEVPAAPPIAEAELTEIEQAWVTPRDELGAILRGERLGADYEKFRADATEKALSRMQGDGGGRER